MKDETGGVAIEKFVGLKLKVYSFLVDNIVNIKKAKGLNRIVYLFILFICLFHLRIFIQDKRASVIIK